MAVSGINTFTVTRNEVIAATLRLLGVIGIGETPNTEDYSNCSQALNIMIKAWAKKGLPLWVTEYLQIPMVDGANPYPLGPTAGYVYSVTSTGGTGYTAGTWTAVGGTTGTAASGTYTVSSGAPDEFTILVPGTAYTTEPTSFTLSGAGSGATITGVIVGVTNPRPLRIMEAFIRNPEGQDTTLLPISRQEYDILGVKTTSGIPNQYYYDDQLVNGNFYVYNVPSADGYTVYATIQRMFFDMTTGSDNFDFPQEWFQALKWGLAAELLAEYGISLQMIPYYEGKAEKYITDCFDWSQEEASIYFQVNYAGGSR
jgi:hypothetical protein